MKSTKHPGIRSRMCPACMTPGAIVPYVKDDSLVSGIVHTGVQCQACGWTKADRRAKHHDLLCMTCMRKIGPKRILQEGGAPSLVCQHCSSKHLERNNPRPLKVRFDVHCPGCGTLVAHYDDWEERAFLKKLSIPRHFCKSVECQMKFSVPRETPKIDSSDLRKGIENVLADLNDRKISKPDAAVAVVQLVLSLEELAKRGG